MSNMFLVLKIPRTPNNNAEAAFDVDEDVMALVNSGKTKYSGPLCELCGRDNHGNANYHAKKHDDGTFLLNEAYEEEGMMFHMDSQVFESDYYDEVSTPASMPGTVV